MKNWKTNMDYRDKVMHDLPKSYQDWFIEEQKYLKKVIKKNAKVLEIWCWDWRSIKDIIDITQNITWIDYDDKAIKYAKLIFENYPNVYILKANALKLPFNDDLFDNLICMTTFANFAKDKFDILSEMKRVLKSEWKIVISVFNEDALSERMKVYNNVKVKIKEVLDWVVCFDFEWANISEQFSKEQLITIFEKSWFVIDDITKKWIAYLCTISKK